uniref:MMS1_N domain-containing protein n=1 Tax=Heligmosomoides polygyrus TaxID=6339 RepID=A0A183F753_HELPZ
LLETSRAPPFAIAKKVLQKPEELRSTEEVEDSAARSADDDSSGVDEVSGIAVAGDGLLLLALERSCNKVVPSVPADTRGLRHYPITAQKPEELRSTEEVEDSAARSADDDSSGVDEVSGIAVAGDGLLLLALSPLLRKQSETSWVVEID